MNNTTTERILTMAQSPEARERKVKWNVAYNADHTTRLPINLNHKTDADIIAYLQTVPNKQGLIKELIRLHMNQVGFIWEAEEDNNADT